MKAPQPECLLLLLAMDVNRPLTSEGIDMRSEKWCVLEYYPRSPLQLTSEGTENEEERNGAFWILSFISQWDAPGMGSNGANVGGKVGELAIFKSAVPSTSAIL
jgi:hypothetical protein